MASVLMCNPVPSFCLACAADEHAADPTLHILAGLTLQISIQGPKVAARTGLERDSVRESAACPVSRVYQRNVVSGRVAS
jgi:hypothetical protein